MGRIQFAAKNIAFGYIGNLASTVLGFLLRTVFIMRLDATLLGVNGLYSGVLTMLSLAELGIGTALNYSLYAPVANKDYEKIKSYMLFYKKTYRVIAGIVAGLGIALIPFLKYFIKNPGNYEIQELTIYYLIFLFNTVSTYFVAYKYSLVNAEQKNYIQTNVHTITKIATTLLQIAVLLTTSNFLLYLLTAAVVELIQKIYVSHYLNKLYPYLKDKNVVPLDKAEKDDIVQKTKALVCHKVGDVARLQTDSIIISSFLQVALVGIVDNYLMVINSISGFVNIIFNSVISSFGNLIATESKEKQYSIFKIYRFVANWIYGLSAIGFYVLLSPLIYLCFGEEWVLGNSVIALILLDYYFKGDRIVLSNFKTAAGVFEQDKYLALIQGAVNLVISIVLVQKMGLVGIYIGTIVSGLIANVTKPIIIYRVCFGMDVKEYFLDTVKHLAVMVLILVIILPLSGLMMKNVTVLSFLLVGILIVLVYNIILAIFFYRTAEFKYLFEIVRGKIMNYQANNQMKIQLSELLYYIFLVLMFVTKGLGLYDGQLIYKLIFLASMLCIAVKIVLTEHTLSEWIMIVVTGLLVVVINRYGGEKGVLIAYAVLIGMKGIPLKRVMQIGAWIYGICMLTMVTYYSVFLDQSLCLTGSRMGVDGVLRYGMGYPHPNTFHVTYLALCAMIIYCVGNKFNLKHVIGLTVGNIYAFVYSMSYTATFTTMMLIVLTWYIVKKKNISVFEYGITALAFPVVLFVSVLAPFSLSAGVKGLLKEKVVTVYHRLELAGLYITKENLSLFGKQASDVIVGDFSVDNSFLYCLLFCGLLFFVAMLLLYSYLMYRLIKEKRNFELLITCVFLVEAIMEPFMFNTSFKNITLFFVGSVIWNREFSLIKKGVFTKKIRFLKDIEINYISEKNLYIFSKLQESWLLYARKIMCACGVSCVVGVLGYVLINPFSGDELNSFMVYVRDLSCLMWLISWGIVIGGTVVCFVRMKNEQ